MLHVVTNACCVSCIAGAAAVLVQLQLECWCSWILQHKHSYSNAIGPAFACLSQYSIAFDACIKPTLLRYIIVRVYYALEPTRCDQSLILNLYGQTLCVVAIWQRSREHNGPTV